MNNEHVYLYVPKKGCGESSIDQQKTGIYYPNYSSDASSSLIHRSSLIFDLWLLCYLQALNSEPTTDRVRGVVLTGGIGAGKTAIIEQLVDSSFFTDGRSGLIEGQSLFLV